jgi:hypothetical protein
MGEERKLYTVLVGKPEGKTTWKMGSEWVLGRIGLGGVDWIRLAQDRDRCCI